jgi:hypothetical protein
VSGTGATTRVVPVNAAITGTVRDSATKQPLGGVIIAIQNTKLSATTNPQGTYRLDVPDSIAKRGSLTLDVRRVGFRAVTRVVRTNATTIKVDFALVGCARAGRSRLAATK